MMLLMWAGGLGALVYCGGYPDEKRREACKFRISWKQYVGEPVLRRMVTFLLQEPNLLRDGSLVDAGANDGTDSLLYANLASGAANRSGLPARLVHAIEPLPQNMVLVQRKANGAPNLLPLHGGLGAQAGVGRIPAALARQKAGIYAQLRSDIGAQQSGSKMQKAIRTFQDGLTFPIYPIDDMVKTLWFGEQIAFMHLDLEGGELSALQGARYTLQQHKPWFTVEVQAKTWPERTTMLLTLISSMRYEAYEIDEICAPVPDCRNVLCVPLLDVAKLLSSSMYRTLKHRLRRLPAPSMQHANMSA